MKRMSLSLVCAASLLLLLAGCSPSSVSIGRTDTIPTSVDVGGATAGGGEPAVGWAPGETSFFVASVPSGICIGVPTAIRAESRHSIHVVFSRSDASACPGSKPVTWELATPSTIDTSAPVSVTITAPNDGSIANNGTFLRTLDAP